MGKAKTKSIVGNYEGHLYLIWVGRNSLIFSESYRGQKQNPNLRVTKYDHF